MGVPSLGGSLVATLYIVTFPNDIVTYLNDCLVVPVALRGEEPFKIPDSDPDPDTSVETSFKQEH